jgi:IS30 family transposase
VARSRSAEWIEKDNLTRIESWASDGLTNKQIAENMGITRQTLDTWCKKNKDIFDALKKGREPVVRELENALIKKAKGFEYEEITTESWIDGNGNKKQKATKYKRYSPPDSSALMFLLKNYKPNKYRNYNDLTKQKIETDVAKAQAEIEKIHFDIKVEDTQNDKILELINKMDAIFDEE